MTARTQTLTAPNGAPAFGPELDAEAITTIRMLAADMVQAANSGHPGMPLGCAPMAWVLWSRFLRHDPSDPAWADRDRFVLSAGHGSALQYALLHLTGYDLPLRELKNFRQLGSATPGHPEFGHTPGVETTTGPLGQGLAAAVGMALAERMLNARFGAVVDHRTFVIAGDGCLMEGISHEAASLAGHLRLGRLIVLFDDNEITIDGPAGQSCSDDVRARFAAYGWHTAAVADGNDLTAVDAAITAALQDERPSLIAVRTVIGEGAPDVAGTSAAHGSPLGADRIAQMRARLDRPDEAFHVPAEVAEAGRALAEAGARAHAVWREQAERWAEADPVAAERLQRAQRLAQADPTTLDEVAQALAAIPTGAAAATRQTSGKVLAALGQAFPELVGGSADLAGSTGTDKLPGGVVTAGDYAGSTLHFGIREHAMAAVLNGIAGHGGLRPFGSTFLVFSDYLRPALRLSALMGLPVIYVFTHDSVAVGEDGPTHQPIEHVEALRLIPGLAVLRPGDDAETVDAWRTALARTDGPTALILTRQGLAPQGVCRAGQIAEVGARVVGPEVANPQLTLLASGSEVGLAVDAAQELAAEGIAARVLSVPWRERFAALDPQQRAELIGRTTATDPDPAPVVAVEAGTPQGWVGLTGRADAVLGLTRFGASGPGPQVLEALGLTPAAVARLARQRLNP